MTGTSKFTPKNASRIYVTSALIKTVNHLELNELMLVVYWKETAVLQVFFYSDLGVHG